MTFTYKKTITEGVGHKHCNVSILINAKGLTSDKQSEIERLLAPILDHAFLGPDNRQLVARQKINIAITPNSLALFLSYSGRGCDTLTKQEVEGIDSDSDNVVKHFLQVLPMFVGLSDDE
jgi:hypothetical protein